MPFLPEEGVPLLAQLALLALTLVTLSLLWIFGDKIDRVAAFTLVATMLLAPLVQNFVIDNLRWVGAILAILLFLTLLGLSLKSDRWWLLAAAGCQLLAVGSYAAAIARPDSLIWAGVTVRWIVWLEIMLVGLFGVWEARAARIRTSGVSSNDRSLVF